MSTIILENSYILDQLSQVVYGLRLEISIFVLAFFAHALLFGKHSILFSSKKGPQQHKAKSVEAPMSPPSSPVPKTASLSVEEFCKGSSGRPESVAAQLRARLEEIAATDRASALTELLRGAGRVPQMELIRAVDTVATDKLFSMNTALGEMLLRGYYAHRSTGKFDALLQDIETNAAAKCEKLAPGVGVQALKGALRKDDLDQSMTRLSAIRHMWESSDNSPSAAPKALLQWISRLALQQDRMPELIKHLKTLKLFEEAFPAILSECAQHGKPTAVRDMEALGRREGLQFDASTYSVLVKNAKENADAIRIFSEAVSKIGASKELVISAAGVAAANQSSSFAETIIGTFSAEAPAEAASKIFQPFLKDDARILSIYSQHFMKVDLSGETSAEKIIAEACLRTKRLDLLKNMLETTDDSTKRVALLKCIGATGNLDDAIAVFRSFPQKGTCLYNTVIDACIDRGRPEAAQQVMEEAMQAGVADTVTYNTIIKAHLLDGKTADAQKTVQLMQASGMEPNCVTFNELLDACIKHDVNKAWALLDEMKACDVKPNHITCSILLKTIKSSSSAQNVQRVLNVMDSLAEDMDEVLLSSVVEACIRASRVDLLVPHLKRQCSAKRVQIRGPHTYGSIIRAYGFVNDISGAWETWREMRSRKIVPTAVTLGCMVEAVVSNGDVEAGYELIQDMLQDTECRHLVNAVIYCSVLKGFSHQKKFNRFWQVYQEMLSQKVKFSIVTFNTMVDACSRCGEMSRIPELLRSMVAQGIEPNLITYSAILKGYCQENRLDEAFELMQGMVQTTKFKPDEIMYNTLLDGCARKGLYDRGMTVLSEMETVGVTPSNFTLSVLVKLCSRAKRLDRAFEIVQEVVAKHRVRPNVHVFSNLIQACIQNKNTARAFDVMEKLLSEGIRPDVRTYSLLLRACISSGMPQDAAGLMRSAAGLRGVHPRLMGFTASALQPQGGLPPALISEVIEGICGPPCRDETLAVALLKDLRSKPYIKVDPKLQMRLTTQAVGNARRLM